MGALKIAIWVNLLSRFLVKCSFERMDPSGLVDSLEGLGFGSHDLGIRLTLMNAWLSVRRVDRWSQA